MKPKCIWLCWEEQRRNWTLAKEFSADYHCLSSQRRGNKILSYMRCIFSTLKILNKTKPDIVFCQNPSIILSLLCTLFKKWYGYKLLVDTHNYSLEKGIPKTVKVLGKFIRKYSDYTIISNAGLSPIVLESRGHPVILPDKLPDLKPEENERCNYVLFICTFAKDEPYEEVFKAARLLPDVPIWVTGNYKKVGINPDDYKDTNLNFLGRIDWAEFETTLRKALVIIDLTTRENCLVCGGYEAVSVEVPLILSDTQALRTYFNRGVIYTKNDAESLAVSIKAAIENNDVLQREIQRLKKELEESWQLAKSRLESLL
jgi:hypothetical protein